MISVESLMENWKAGVRVVRSKLQRAAGWKSCFPGPEEGSGRGKRQSPVNYRIKRRLSQSIAEELANMDQDRPADPYNPIESTKCCQFLKVLAYSWNWYFENGADFIDVDPLRFQQFGQDVTHFDVGNILHVSQTVRVG